MQRWGKIVLFAGIGLAVGGCAKGRTDFNQGRKAQQLQDYDAAFDYYEKALRDDPENAEYLIKFNQARFEASALHVKNGVKVRESGQLEASASEFQRAIAIDPSSPIAGQEMKKTVAMIEQRNRANNAAAERPREDDSGEDPLASVPPELKPLSNAPISLRMTNDAKIVFDTIGKLAGLTVVYDPDLPARRITADLNNVTLKQALEITSVESKAFWKAMTENIIFVIPDQPAKRRDYEETVVRTFYLSNTAQPQDLTEIVTSLRQLLDLKRIQQLNGDNAIVIRDSPDKLAVVEKIIQDIDKVRPEVIVQVQVLEARVDRMRNLGILPGQSASIAFVPPGTTTTNNSNNNANNGTNTTNNSNASISLQNLAHLNGSDYAVSLPSFTANALLSDATTKVIQNPEIRSVDGQSAKLNIGDRVPVATGSFQAGVGVGGTAGTGFVNPLVNTQFQYIDVGVNIELTPRVHPNHDVSLKLQVEVSSTSSSATIGGIQQPIISQRKIAHEIRLKEGESSVLAGLVTKSDMKQLNGWPGVSHIPILRYLFSSDNRQFEDDEILMILTPHILRMPEWTKSNVKALYTGSETNVQVLHESEVRGPQRQPPGPPQPSDTQAPTLPANANPSQSRPRGQVRFEPRSVSLKVGQITTVGVAVENVNDLFSIPFFMRYDPAIISVQDVQHGDFLQAGDQEIAIVQQVDKEHGQAIISALRQPNTAGVSGTGTILGIVIKALAPGTSRLSIGQVSARDSQQRPIPLMTTEANVQVAP